MLTIESCRTVPPLTRFARAMARLVGVGATLGIGLSALQIWDVLPRFVANNELKMSLRLHLLSWFFAPLLLLPAVVSVVVVCRVNDPRRLFTLETWARRLSPLTLVGLLPLLMHGKMWEGKPLLFLVTTLTCTLIAYGSLRSISLSATSVDVRRVFRFIDSSLPVRLTAWAPWVVLAAFMAAVVAAAVGSLPTPPSVAQHVSTASSFHQAIRVLGHGGLLAVPFVSSGKFVVGSSLHHLVFLLLTAMAALPLYAWASKRVGRGMALGLAVFYLSFPPLLSVGGRAPLSLGVAAGCFFSAAYAWESRRYWMAAIATLLMLLVHEQTAAWLLCLCVYWGIEQRRHASVAPWLAAALVGYFVAVGWVVLPAIGVEPYGDKMRSLWAASTPGMGSALETLFANPARALSRWCEQRDLVFWLSVIVPFAFFPIKGKTWFLWAIPFAWFGVVATGHTPPPTLTEPTISHFIVMGFAAAVTTLDGLTRSGRRGLAWATWLTWAFALLPCVQRAGCLWQAP